MQGPIACGWVLFMRLADQGSYNWEHHIMVCTWRQLEWRQNEVLGQTSRLLGGDWISLNPEWIPTWSHHPGAEKGSFSLTCYFSNWEIIVILSTLQNYTVWAERMDESSYPGYLACLDPHFGWIQGGQTWTKVATLYLVSQARGGDFLFCTYSQLHVFWSWCGGRGGEKEFGLYNPFL